MNVWSVGQNKDHECFLLALCLAEVDTWRQSVLHPNNLSGNADFSVLPPPIMTYAASVEKQSIF